MRLLVSYGSKRGGTEGIARILGERLRELGFDVDVEPADRVRTIDDYDAAIIGGALYSLRWHRTARRLVRRHTAALRARPVWFFSSGPLDDSARDSEIPPVRGVRKLIDRVGARGHQTFGGRLESDATGFPASAMAKEQAGDWRDREQITAWADAVAAQLGVARTE